MESAVQVQMFAFLDENKVLSVFQPGFRKKRSTETAVVYLVVPSYQNVFKLNTNW